jgi:hypothetical protein
MPHVKCWLAQVFGVQVPPVPQMFGLATPQLSPVGQVPQPSVPLQPSDALPQLKLCDAQVFGVQVTTH